MLRIAATATPLALTLIAGQHAQGAETAAHRSLAAGLYLSLTVNRPT